MSLFDSPAANQAYEDWKSATGLEDGSAREVFEYACYIVDSAREDGSNPFVVIQTLQLALSLVAASCEVPKKDWVSLVESVKEPMWIMAQEHQKDAPIHGESTGIVMPFRH